MAEKQLEFYPILSSSSRLFSQKQLFQVSCCYNYTTFSKQLEIINGAIVTINNYNNNIQTLEDNVILRATIKLKNTLTSVLDRIQLFFVKDCNAVLALKAIFNLLIRIRIEK